MAFPAGKRRGTHAARDSHGVGKPRLLSNSSLVRELLYFCYEITLKHSPSRLTS